MPTSSLHHRQDTPNDEKRDEYEGEDVVKRVWCFKRDDQFKNICCIGLFNQENQT